MKDYNTVAKPDWCPGCGNFGIQVAIKQALTNLQIDPHQVACVTDIGCSGKIAHWINSYGLHSLHGRALPCATGVKFANRDLTVLVNAGDGGGYGIGMGHLVHTIRRNVNLTYIVHNNKVYGLTKGQMTPTSDKGFKTPSSPFGAIEEPLNPVAMALTLGATFVARGSAGDAIHLTKILEAAIQHNGFALVDVFQPCVTFNKNNSYAHLIQKTYNLDKEEGYDRTNWQSAMNKAQENDRLPVGILFQVNQPSYEDQDAGRADLAAVKLPIDRIDIKPLMAEYY